MSHISSGSYDRRTKIKQQKRAEQYFPYCSALFFVRQGESEETFELQKEMLCKIPYKNKKNGNEL